jgi:NADPH2 dehydrogenase
MKTFEHFAIRDLELKNRIVMAPMCMYQSDETGIVKPFHLHHYATRAIGGVGLVIVEATAVEPRGRITERDLGIWSDDHVGGLKDLVDAVHANGAKIGIQIAHAGRKASVKESIVSSTGNEYSEQYQTPKELSEAEAAGIVLKFKAAAIRAKAAGFDAIELHGAHGYLINQFLSPLTNNRTDKYGGTKAKRRVFLKEILAEVRTVWDKALILRLSAEEYAERGNHLADTLETLLDLAVTPDIVHVSSGGVVSVPINAFPLYQIPLAKAIKELGFPTIGGGLVTSAEQVEAILTEGQADLVFLARELLRNPYFALKAAASAGRKDLIPKPYERGF